MLGRNQPYDHRFASFSAQKSTHLHSHLISSPSPVSIAHVANCCAHACDKGRGRNHRSWYLAIGKAVVLYYNNALLVKFCAIFHAQSVKKRGAAPCHHALATSLIYTTNRHVNTSHACTTNTLTRQKKGSRL